LPRNTMPRSKTAMRIGARNIVCGPFASVPGILRPPVYGRSRPYLTIIFADKFRGIRQARSLPSEEKAHRIGAADPMGRCGKMLITAALLECIRGGSGDVLRLGRGILGVLERKVLGDLPTGLVHQDGDARVLV